MKKFILTLAISVLMLGTISKVESSPINFLFNHIVAAPNHMPPPPPPPPPETPLEKVLNDIYLEDTRYRRPDLIFTEQNRRIIVSRKSDNSHVQRIQHNTRGLRVYYARKDYGYRNNFNLFYASMPPILTSWIKSHIDFTALPLGFEIINPDKGFVKERWDGEEWLTPADLSAINFNYKENAGRPGQ